MLVSGLTHKSCSVLEKSFLCPNALAYFEVASLKNVNSFIAIHIPLTNALGGFGQKMKIKKRRGLHQTLSTMNRDKPQTSTLSILLIPKVGFERIKNTRLFEPNFRDKQSTQSKCLQLIPIHCRKRWM